MLEVRIGIGPVDLGRTMLCEKSCQRIVDQFGIRAGTDSLSG